MKNKVFSKEEIDRINRAAAEVERRSSGEVLTAVIRESAGYAAPEMVFAGLFGFLFYLAAMAFYVPVADWINSIFWVPAAWFPAAFIGGCSMLAAGLFYLLANIPAVDRLIVPSSVMRKAVHRRALVHFVESGAANTADRTGILFFVSLRERMVEIIADEGINSKVEPGCWDAVLKDLLSDMASGRAGSGLEKAVRACGDILAESFPVKNDDVNELPDGIVFLED